MLGNRIAFFMAATAVISALTAFFLPNYIVTAIEATNTRLLLGVLSWLCLSLLSAVIFWFYFDIRPLKVTAGICKTLTAILILSTGSTGLGIPSIKSMTITDNRFYIDVLNDKNGLAEIAIYALFALVIAGAVVTLAFYVEKHVGQQP